MVPESRWSRRKDRERDRRDRDDAAASASRASSDDDSIDLDDQVDSWWTGRGDGDDHHGNEVKSHSGPRTADEIREAFKRKRKRPDPAAKPHGAFSDYYSADSLFTADDSDPDLFDPEDPYIVLGISTTATWEQITSAHRRLAKLHHPDRLLAATDEDRTRSEQRMAEINIAYAELRKRRGA